LNDLNERRKNAILLKSYISVYVLTAVIMHGTADYALSRLAYGTKAV
jgi:hypothetical protein